MRRSDISFAVLLLLLACGDSSIGQDTCTGTHTSCAETRLVTEPEQLPFGDRHAELDGAELSEIEPRWQRPLSFVSEQEALPDKYSFNEQGMLLGNGRAGLWYVNTTGGSAGIEVYELDEQGEPIDSALIEPPPSKLFAVAGQGNPEIQGMALYLNDQGAAPLLSLAWSNRTCANQGGCPRVTETVALDTDLHAGPWRIPQSYPAYAVRSVDGGLWAFGSQLSKHDVRGKLEIQQTLFGERATVFPIRAGVSGGSLGLPHIATTTTQALWVYAFDKDGCPELWRLKEQGSVDRHFALNFSCNNDVDLDQGRAALAVDQQDRAVAFIQARTGDLVAYRVDVESRERDDWSVDSYRVLRDDYVSLAPMSLTEDRAGNLYVSTLSGSRDKPVPMLCKLPLAGDLSCFTWRSLPQGMFVNSVKLVGGEEDVVYVHYVVEVGSVTREMLARFDLSCELAAKTEGGAGAEGAAQALCGQEFHVTAQPLGHAIAYLLYTEELREMAEPDPGRARRSREARDEAR